MKACERNEAEKYLLQHGTTSDATYNIASTKFDMNFAGTRDIV